MPPTGVQVQRLLVQLPLQQSPSTAHVVLPGAQHFLPVLLTMQNNPSQHEEAESHRV